MTKGDHEKWKQAEADRDRLRGEKERLRKALRNLVDAINYPDKMGGFLLDAAEQALTPREG